MQSKSEVSRRRVTDRLWVSTYVDVEDTGKVIVNSDKAAKLVLRAWGLPACCAESRISVSHGGPVTCDGNHGSRV